MGSFSGLGIGLSFLFGCILMGVVCELYYLLWWKKKIGNTNNTREIEDFSFLFCFRKPKSFHNIQELTNSVRNQQEDLEMGSTKGYNCEEGVEAELMRIHNLCGPPRFLFTIKEESKEDLESDDGRSRKGSRTRSLSDLVLTPLSSPPVKTPLSLDSYNSYGFNNPLFESLSEAELNRLRSSPPPKFKFLKDAEDKLLRRLLEEEAERKLDLVSKDCHISKMGSQEEKSDYFVRDKLHNQASQVLPLASSPTFGHSAA